MTQNQINYQNYVELKRSNLAREQETNRANLSNEDIKRGELAEQGRHNLVSEGTEAKKAETSAKQAEYSYELGKLQQMYNYQNLQEQITHNRISESNQLALGQLSASTSAANAQLAAEVSAANAALAAETSKYNTEYSQQATNARHSIDTGIKEGELQLKQNKDAREALKSPSALFGTIISEFKNAPVKGVTSENQQVKQITPNAKKPNSGKQKQSKIQTIIRPSK